MDSFTIVVFVMMIVVYHLINYFVLKKRLKIKEGKSYRWIFSKERDNLFVVIDKVMLVLFFLVVMFVVLRFEMSSAFLTPFGLFFLLSITSGLEEYFKNKEAKAHYRAWLSSLILLIGFLILFIFKRDMFFD